MKKTKNNVKSFRLWEQDEQSSLDDRRKQYLSRTDLTDYIKQLNPNDVKIVDGEISPTELVNAAADSAFNGGSYSHHITIDTPKYTMKFEVIANASGGSDYGFVDPDIEFEFFLDDCIVIDTGEHIPARVEDEVDDKLESILGLM